MDAPPNADTQLLQHVLDGDVRAAGTLLVRGYADEVYALCSAMLRDRTLAEDLSQEVFTRAFKALPGFRGDASVRTWILRIARNRCIDHLRAQKREPWMDEEEPDAHATPEPSVTDLISRREDVQTGLSALSENERALVVLRFGHELGYPELADAFGLGQGAVRMRISRAVAKMREALIAPPPAQAMEMALEAQAGAPPPLRSPGLPPAGAPPALPHAPAPAPAPAAPPPRAAPPPQRRPAPSAPRSRASFGLGGGGHPPGRGAAAAPPPSPFRQAAPRGLRAHLEAMAGALD